ncbi:hypothetical protein EYR40_000803 [Pleurotus pulmonarius]|nr:hypothetical protein EYR40_000803 [Pleurotus pulmonarius]
MAAPGQNPRNPFHNYPHPQHPQYQQPIPQPYQQARSEYDAESELGDHYSNSVNGSTTRLAGSPGYYDQSDSDVYGRRYNPSVDSHSSIPSISPFADPGVGSSEPYPAWSAERQIPMSAEEIEDIFLDLTQKFGFQRDSMRNMYDFLMQLLDSRASRMTPNQALLTVHADYIGGQHANYRKWYFAAQLNLDDAVGQSNNPGLQRLKSVKAGAKTGGAKSLDSALNRWRNAMNNMSHYDRIRQLALYLLCWGEAGNVRFVPECLCFIFKCADDYYRSPECQNRVEPVREGLYLENIIKPLYRFMRDQGYEVVDGKFVRREKDHAQIIGYDDINQLFWYPEGIARIVLSDNTRLVDAAPAQRFMKLMKVDWNRVFFKTYFEKRSIAHLLVNFNRIWVLHVAVFYFYTAFNSPKVYAPRNKNNPSAPMTWSATALGGAVATGIMILATLAEFSSPIAVMARTKVQGCSDKFFGSALCSNQVPFALAIMYVMDLILFFLDTYLWYIIWIVVFSIGRSFSLGLSIWTPWKDIYTRLPKRIYAKLLATAEMEVKYKPKVLVSQIWNAVIISMYREHLLSIDNVQRLLYHQVDSPDGRRTLRAPPFFTNQEGGNFFPSGGEAERRISFFASSLTTALPEPLPVDAMPTFTVLVPHYSEKILLSLREIIREEDQNTRVTLLEYLKQLHPVEWDNFVKDTKILAEESEGMDGATSTNIEKKTDDLPFYCIGFKTSSPEYTLRTRIWASLRAQTLYRTVSGMMNYSKAIKLLYRVENPDIVQTFGGNTERLERELERMARRKFKFAISMQRFSKFNKDEQENAEFLLRAYPDLQIAYLDEEPGPKGGEARLFSTLIDGHSEIDEKTGKRKPKFRIELPGNPILGDGKSDNQNHAIVFYRELVERGTGKALLRLGKHFLSLSPIFEVFSTQIYSQSILSNLTFGGARYIATGRGFATTRINFSILYSRFAGPSIYMGMRNLLLLLYATMSLWMPHLIYFWASVLSLCIAPFVFNPHQFSFADFIIDYREYLRWMSRGNSRTKASSWYGYCRLSRTMITGYKKKKLGHPSEKLSGDVPRATWRSVIFSEVVFPVCVAIVFVVAYMFVKSFPDANGDLPPSPLIRIAVIAIGPVVWNAAVLMALFFIALFLGPMMDSWIKFGSVMAAIAHVLGLVGLVAFFEFFWFLELWDASHAVLGVICVVAIQRAIQKFLISVVLTREYKHDETNRAWWTGKWYGRGLGNSAMSQPAREFIVKIVEMSLWTSDFLIGHILLIILTPPILIPYFNRLHSTMLFWLRPSKQIRAPLFSTKQKRTRRWIVIKYTFVYMVVVSCIAALIVLPALFRDRITFECSICKSI